LTKDTFDAHIEGQQAQQRPCLVMFHVGWCKVCQRVFPKFAAASDQVLEKGIKMDFAHVDCTDDKTLCTRFNVKGYPTIKLFPVDARAEPLNYRNLRAEHMFVKYADRMTRPPLRREFRSYADISKALSNETLSVFVAAAGSAGDAGLAAAAEKWMDRHIFAVGPRMQDLLPEGVDPPAGASLAVLSAGKQQWPGRKPAAAPPPAVDFFAGSLDDAEAVEKWVEGHRFPGIWVLDDSTFYDFTHASRDTVMVALDPANVSKGSEEQLRASAVKFGARFTFGVLDGVSWAQELRDFNIAKEDLPRVLVTESDLEAWVEDVERLRAGSLEADLGALAAGAPLLRQSRGVWSKLHFYRREAIRLAVRLYAYASQGALEAGMVCAGALAAVALVCAALWCVVSCCRSLLADDVDPEYLQHVRDRQKRD